MMLLMLMFNFIDSLFAILNYNIIKKSTVEKSIEKQRTVLKDVTVVPSDGSFWKTLLLETCSCIYCLCIYILALNNINEILIYIYYIITLNTNLNKKYNYNK